MANPLIVIPLMLRAARPSRLEDMSAVSCPFWIRKGYAALTFFGHIITGSTEEARHFDQHFDALKNHEMIHLHQARSTHDSWLCFYWKYGIFWLKGQRYRRHLKNAGYWLNPFELEAYAHMHDLSYLEQLQGKGACGWKEYARMTLKERLQVYNRSSWHLV